MSPAPLSDPRQYERWRQKQVIPVGKSHLQVSRLSADDRYVLVISTVEYAIRIYEIESARLRWQHALPGYESLDRIDAVFWPDTSEELRFVMAGKDGVSLRDAASGQVVERWTEGPAWSVGWSPDEQILVAKRSLIPEQRSELAFLVRGPGHTMKVVAKVPTPHRIDDWALSADNRLFASIGYPSNDVVLRRLDTGETLWSVPAPRYAGGVAISPDGAWVAAGGEHLLVVDARNPERRSVYRRFGNNINTVAFSRSGDALLASSYDGRIRIFANGTQTAELTLIRELRHGGTANVYDLSLLRDGSGVVSASGDRTVRWWGL